MREHSGVLETHNGLSGIIADTMHVDGNEFGLRTLVLPSSHRIRVQRETRRRGGTTASMRLPLVRDTMEVTQKPMIYDADTGGQPRFCVSQCARWKTSA